MIHVSESRENILDSALALYLSSFVFGLNKLPTGTKAQQTAPQSPQQITDFNSQHTTQDVPCNTDPRSVDNRSKCLFLAKACPIKWTTPRKYRPADLEGGKPE